MPSLQASSVIKHFRECHQAVVADIFKFYGAERAAGRCYEMSMDWECPAVEADDDERHCVQCRRKFLNDLSRRVHCDELGKDESEYDGKSLAYLTETQTNNGVVRQIWYESGEDESETLYAHFEIAQSQLDEVDAVVEDKDGFPAEMDLSHLDEAEVEDAEDFAPWRLATEDLTAASFRSISRYKTSIYSRIADACRAGAVSAKEIAEALGVSKQRIYQAVADVDAIRRSYIPLEERANTAELWTAGALEHDKAVPAMSSNQFRSVAQPQTKTKASIANDDHLKVAATPDKRNSPSPTSQWSHSPRFIRDTGPRVLSRLCTRRRDQANRTRRRAALVPAFTGPMRKAERQPGIRDRDMAPRSSHPPYQNFPPTQSPQDSQQVCNSDRKAKSWPILSGHCKTSSMRTTRNMGCATKLCRSGREKSAAACCIFVSVSYGQQGTRSRIRATLPRGMFKHCLPNGQKGGLKQPRSSPA